MLVRASLLLVFLAAAAVFPYLALCQDDAVPNAPARGEDDFSDDPPDKPASSPPERSEPSESKPSPSSAQPSPQVERRVEAAPEPEAVAAKLAIRDALVRKDAPAAERLFQTALKRFPSDPDFRAIQTGRALRLHEEKVRAILGRALTDGSRLFGRQWQPGRMMQDGETEVGLEIAWRGTRARNAAVDGALAQGYDYINRGDPMRAEKVLSGAIRTHQNSAELHYARVLAHGLGGNLKKADEDSLRAVKLSREQPVTLSQRASLMMTMGRREEAFAWATRALEGNSQDADALVIRGRVLWLDRKRPDLAIEDFKKAALIDPERNKKNYEEWSRLFLRTRATNSMSKGDFKQALADADTILASDPADALARTVRGTIFLDAGKVEEAIKETTLALKSDPRSMWALFFRAKAMETLGARKQALADLKRATAIDPGRFRGTYESLLRAQSDGAPPLWVRKINDGVLADSR